MRYATYDLKFNNLVGQKTKCPLASTFWWLAAAECNDLCLNITGDLRLDGWGLALLATDGSVQPICGISLSYRVNSLSINVVELSDLLFTSFGAATFIGSKQNMSVHDRFG